MPIKPYEVHLENERATNANVAEMYKEWTLAEIRADLDTRRSEVVQIFMNLTTDFNKASGIRVNNAFSGSAVYIVGKRHYNRVGSVGTHHYEHVFSANTLQEVVEKLHGDGYTVYAVDNIMSYEPKSMWDVEFPSKTAFVYGEEQRGLQAEDIALCDAMVYCEMTGSVRSLNVANASAVLLSEYTRQHRGRLISSR